MKKDFIPVLLGSDDNVYGFARSFHALYGIKPIALATTILEPTQNSKILDVIVDPDLHDEEHFALKLVELARKLKKEYDRVFIVPCSDEYMELVCKHKNVLTDYENEFIELDKLKRFNDKESFYKMCDEYKMPYPKSYLCNKKDYKKVLSKIDLDYPLILKPNNSNSEEYLTASFPGKEKVYFINSAEELLEKIETIYTSSYQDTLIIQKYVAGDDTNMRVLNAYVDKHGKVKMMCLGQPILEEYHPKTFGNYAAIISKTEHISIMDDVKRFLENIGYRGAANFDIKMDANTGKYYLFEINPRPGRSSFFTYPAGKSFAACYVEDLIYDNITPCLNATKEILWLNVPLYLVKKYVKNEEILDKVNELKKSKEVYHTLRYKKDASISRRIIWKKQYLRKAKYFPKYYIDKK